MPVVVAGVQDSAFPAIDSGQFVDYFFFSVTPSGNYPAGGDPMSFAGAHPLLLSNRPPVGPVTMQSQSAANGHSGYTYYYRPGAPATIANGKFQVLVTGGAGNTLQDLGASNPYPAAITNDTIVGSAQFSRS